MLRRLRPLALFLALALAFAPVIGSHWWLPSPDQAEAQFSALTQGKTLQNAATATGNGASIDTSGNPIVAMQVSGTFVGTIIPEGSLDGSNWSPLACQLVGIATEVLTFSSPESGKIFRCNTVAIPVVRARISSVTKTGLPTGVTFTSITVKAFATQSYFPLGTNVP